jgi:hypothetical protein
MIDPPRIPASTQPIADHREPDDALPSAVDRALAVALVVLALVGLVGWLFLSASHLTDRYGINHVQAARIGLERYASEGTLYPPLFDGEHYGGTRWMPLPIVFNAAVADLTGDDYLVSGKVVGLSISVILLAVVFALLRRYGTRPSTAVALVATIVATSPGRFVGTTLGGDVIPVTLQIGALAVVTFVRRPRLALAIAGVLSGLAFSSKSTGVWAALAIASWLALHRRWRDLAVFVSVVGASMLAVLGAVEFVSEGRFTDNVIGLSTAGIDGGAALARAPNQLIFHIAVNALAACILVPFAVLSMLIGSRGTRFTLPQLSLAWATPLLLLALSDVGVDFNQTIDLVVLIALVVGAYAGSLPASGYRAPMAALLALAIIWGTGSGIVLTLLPDIRETAAGRPLGPAVHPLSGLIDPTDEILSEDPFVPLSLGQTPIVLDPFMLRRIDEVEPAAVDALIERIEGRDFDHVVTIEPLHDTGAVAEAAGDDGMPSRDDTWWEEYHFGLRVVSALRRNYTFEGLVDGYYLYRPLP